MSANVSVSLNPDEVAVALGLVDTELAYCVRHNCPIGYINLACSDDNYEEDAVADTRYVARLAIIIRKLQETD